eukprot:s892_g10.t1
MPLEVLSAPSNPVVCHPGEDLELCWQLRFPGTVAAGAQLQLRESREASLRGLMACLQVQHFVLSSAGEILGDLNICLSIRNPPKDSKETEPEVKELEKTLCSLDPLEQRAVPALLDPLRSRSKSSGDHSWKPHKEDRSLSVDF